MWIFSILNPWKCYESPITVIGIPLPPAPPPPPPPSGQCFWADSVRFVLHDHQHPDGDMNDLWNLRSEWKQQRRHENSIKVWLYEGRGGRTQTEEDEGEKRKQTKKINNKLRRLNKTIIVQVFWRKCFSLGKKTTANQWTVRQNHQLIV